MLGTRPRRIASSAISRWLQWLIGRSLSDGFSQVIAITAQICSGVPEISDLRLPVNTRATPSFVLTRAGPFRESPSRRPF
jgi:hypothetical protein